MSTTPTVELQITSPTQENIFRSFRDAFASLRAEMIRPEIEKKRLVDHNTVIEKELVTLNKENIKLTGANDDAIKKLAKVEDEKAGLQKELSVFEGLKEVLEWKKRCGKQENRVTENQERMEKLLESYQQEMEKRIAEVQEQGQQNLEQAIDQIKAHHAPEMQDLAIDMRFMGLEDWEDGYIFREKPLKIIRNGMIQVNRAKSSGSGDQRSNGPPHEDEDSHFLYVVRDQFKNFKKFTKLAESVFGLDAGHLTWLKGTKSRFLTYDGGHKAEVINK
ncbi:hypothetical protein FPQ18DRAFT_423065 [Pyronema domesticum]|uniref:Uncharacterized protein n=1 Tax=Pyronema omphalodes (strain CBS 100304) TaxID=1076935 RepID=U4L6L2_PYROM|nr:hypothetical protein FPQ18DRAFT_423065 [Pyronema domesticum]CCX05665.1 Protein of unknown function [Pyronema omphalodes CBS 100304]